MRRRDIPNIISVIRILLVIPIVIFLVFEEFATALVLFFVAGVSDGLDGYLAKRFDWTSRLGSILDPIADKLLLVCGYLVLGWEELLPAWLVGAVIGRDVVILVGALAYYKLVGGYEMAPSLISKVNTFSQIVLVLAVVIEQVVPMLPELLVTGLVFTVLVTTVLSGIDYVWTWGMKAVNAKRTR